MLKNRCVVLKATLPNYVISLEVERHWGIALGLLIATDMQYQTISSSHVSGRQRRTGAGYPSTLVSSLYKALDSVVGVNFQLE